VTRTSMRPSRRLTSGLVWNVLNVVISTTLLVLIGLHVDGNVVTEAERVVFRFMNGLPSFFYRPVWVVMQLGNLIVVPAVAVIALVLRRYRLAIASLLVGVGKWYFSLLLKDSFFRQRPASVLSDVIVRDVPTAGQAFVSGHAVIVVGLAVILQPYVGRKWRIVIWVAAAFVCAARVYVGAHLPLDVVGGACAGSAIGSAANLLTNLFSNRWRTHTPV
jgi:membrane-associated phospholipid phosphatase